MAAPLAFQEPNEFPPPAGEPVPIGSASQAAQRPAAPDQPGPAFQVQEASDTVRLLLTKKQYAALHQNARGPGASRYSGAYIAWVAVAVAIGLVFGLLGVLVLAVGSRIAFSKSGKGFGNTRGRPTPTADGRHEQIWRVSPSGILYADKVGPVSIPWTQVKSCALADRQVTLTLSNGGGRYELKTDVVPNWFLSLVVSGCKTNRITMRKGSGKSFMTALFVLLGLAIVLVGATLFNDSRSDGIGDLMCPDGQFTIIHSVDDVECISM